MKIIKHGDKAQYKFYVKCTSCGCVFELSYVELQKYIYLNYFPGTLNIESRDFMCPCPDCHRMIIYKDFGEIDKHIIQKEKK